MASRSGHIHNDCDMDEALDLLLFPRQEIVCPIMPAMCRDE